MQSRPSTSFRSFFLRRRCRFVSSLAYILSLGFESAHASKRTRRTNMYQRRDEKSRKKEKKKKKKKSVCHTQENERKKVISASQPASHELDECFAIKKINYYNRLQMKAKNRCARTCDNVDDDDDDDNENGVGLFYSKNKNFECLNRSLIKKL
jgi:hypothetical protein